MNTEPELEKLKREYPKGMRVVKWGETFEVTGHRLTRTYKQKQLQVLSDNRRSGRMWIHADVSPGEKEE